jgi:hypothetical protein
LFIEFLMTKKLLLVLLFSSVSFLYGQTIKTDVLVIGNNPGGVAAAIQCARSKVKTILAIPDTAFTLVTTAGISRVNSGRNLPSGIWGEFRKQVKDFYQNTAGYDTLQSTPLQFEANRGASILKKMADTVKNLNLYTNSMFMGIKKDGDRWEVIIKQNEKTITVKARVVVDATDGNDLITKAGGRLIPPFDNTKDSAAINAYRTSIVCGDAWPEVAPTPIGVSKTNYPASPAYSIPISNFIVRDIDNLLVTEKALGGKHDIEYLPLQLAAGQGVGTIAAFCAFFKTTTQKLNVRTIQGELLDFKGYLLPFTDISKQDPAWRAIQQVGATGLFKGVGKRTGDSLTFAFRPDSLVNTAEIKPVLLETYTRAFLWFNREKPGEKFTVGNLVSFISDYTLTEPLFLKSTLQKAWKIQYKFTFNFDMNRQVTRREFAVLANRYLNPFARAVDLSGRLVN